MWKSVVRSQFTCDGMKLIHKLICIHLSAALPLALVRELALSHRLPRCRQPDAPALCPPPALSSDMPAEGGGGGGVTVACAEHVSATAGPRRSPPPAMTSAPPPVRQNRRRARPRGARDSAEWAGVGRGAAEAWHRNRMAAGAGGQSARQASLCHFHNVICHDMWAMIGIHLTCSRVSRNSHIGM